MSLFDIIGPIMVGPSSSHTAGAARIGYITRQIMGEDIVHAQIDLYGSFLATGKGHGTDKALVAGLLGMKPDDERIPFSFEIAKERGMEFHFGEAYLRDAHPNTVVLTVTGASGRVRTLEGVSVGGGCIRVNKIDDMEANFTGDYPTLLLRNNDKPGMIQKIVTKLGEFNINIANFTLSKDMKKKGTAITIIECDDPVPAAMVEEISSWEDIGRVIYLYSEDMVISEETRKKLDEYNERKHLEKVAKERLEKFDE